MATELGIQALEHPTAVERERGGNGHETPRGTPELVETVRRSLGGAEEYGMAADLFHVLSDATRLRLIAALAKQPLCVGELSEVVKLGQSATSHALRILRDRGIARAQREGQQVRYHLADESLRGLIASGWHRAVEGDLPEALAQPEPQFTGEIKLKDGAKAKKKKDKSKKKKKKI